MVCAVSQGFTVRIGRHITLSCPEGSQRAVMQCQESTTISPKIAAHQLDLQEMCRVIERAFPHVEVTCDRQT